jgi:hypothetical protein
LLRQWEQVEVRLALAGRGAPDVEALIQGRVVLVVVNHLACPGVDERTCLLPSGYSGLKTDRPHVVIVGAGAGLLALQRGHGLGVLGVGFQRREFLCCGRAGPCVLALVFLNRHGAVGLQRKLRLLRDVALFDFQVT